MKCSVVLDYITNPQQHNSIELKGQLLAVWRDGHLYIKDRTLLAKGASITREYNDFFREVVGRGVPYHVVKGPTSGPQG